MAGPFDLQPLPPLWNGPVPMPPEWGPLDLPSSSEADLAAAAIPRPEPALQPPLQPGLGIPQAVVDQVPAAPPVPMDPYVDRAVEIGAPVVEPSKEVVIGEPTVEPTPPPLVPDAVSGVDRVTTDAEKDLGQALELSRNPLALAYEELDLEKRRTAEAGSQQRANLERDAAQLVSNQKIIREADTAARASRAEVAQKAQVLAGEVPSIEGKSILERIGAVILATVGGAFQGKTGAKSNPGIDIVDSWIKGEVDAHRRKVDALETRRKEIDVRYAGEVDRFKQEEILRQTLYEQAARKVEADAAQFDPRGTNRLKMAQQAAMLRQKAAAAGQVFAEKDFERQLKVLNYGLEERKVTAEERKNQLTAIGETEDNRKYTPAELQSLYPGNPVPPVPMDRKHYDQWQTTFLKGRKDADERRVFEEENVRKFAVGGPPELVTEGGRPAYNADGTPKVTRNPLTNANGKIWLAGDETTRRNIEDKMTAASQITDIIDRALAIRDESGGELGVLNSDAYQELKVLENQLQLLTKQGTQGMSSDKDMEALRGAVGAADITSLRARSAGLEAGRERTVKALNQALKSAKYDGKPLRFPKASTKKAEDSVVDEMLRRVAGDRDRSSASGSMGVALDFARAQREPGETSDNPALSRAREIDGYSKKVDEALGILSAYALQPGRRGDEARKGLAALSERAVSPGSRAKAKAILESLPGKGQRTGEAR